MSRPASAPPAVLHPAHHTAVRAPPAGIERRHPDDELTVELVHLGAEDVEVLQVKPLLPPEVPPQYSVAHEK